MLHPFDVRILRRDTELAPRVHIRADDGAGRIAIVCVRVGEQTVPNDGGAIAGVAESQFNPGGAFQCRSGFPIPVVHGGEQCDSAIPVGLLAQHLQECQILMSPRRISNAADATLQLVENQDHVPVAKVRTQCIQVRWSFSGPVGAEMFRNQQPQGIVRERVVGQLPGNHQRVVGRRPLVAERLHPRAGDLRACEQVVPQQQGVGLAETLGGVGEEGSWLRAAVEPIAQASDEGVDIRRGPGEIQEAGSVSFQAGGRAGMQALKIDDPIQILRRCVAFFST